MFSEMIVAGGWKSAVVAVLSLASLIALAIGARTRALPTTLMTLAVGVLLTVEQIGDHTIEALQVESPGDIQFRLVAAIVNGVGPLVVALVGCALVCVVRIFNSLEVARRATNEGA